MFRIIRSVLWAIAGTACLIVIMDGWLTGDRDEMLAGLAAVMFLAGTWLASYAWREAERERMRVRALAAENAELAQENQACIRTIDWLCHGVTIPMQRMATKPLPVLRLVPRHRC